MKQLFLYLARSIKWSPFQTLLLLLTVFLTGILFVSTFEMSDALIKESKNVRTATYGNAQLVLSPDGDSEVNYLTISQLNADNITASCGTLALPAYLGEGENFRSALGSATDFYAIDGVFRLELLSSCNIDGDKINQAVLLSQDFAEANGLSVGDAFEISLLGKKTQYTVSAINRHPFFGAYDFIVHSEGALGVLASVSPVFAVFDGNDPPYNEIYLRAEGDLGQVQAQLNANLEQFDWSASLAEEKFDYFDSTMQLVLIVVTLFSAILSGALLLFTLNVIAERRAKEMQTFSLAGMERSKMLLAFAVELFLIIAVGTALCLGVCALALPNLSIFNSLTYASVSLGAGGALTCIAGELCAGAICFFAYLLSGKKGRGVGIKTFILSVLSLLVCVVTALCVPTPIAYPFAMAALLPILLALLSGIPLFLKVLARLSAPTLEGKRVGNRLALSLKNCARVSGLSQALRILSVVLSFAVALGACFSFSEKMLVEYQTTFDCDYVVLHAGEAVKERATTVAGTQEAALCFFGTGELPDGKTVYMADCEQEGFLLGQPSTPAGNGIVIPRVIANLYGAQVGTVFEITVNHVPLTLTVSAINDSDARICYFNADTVGIQKNMLLVRGEQDGAYLSRLTAELSVYGAVVREPVQLFSSLIKYSECFAGMMQGYILFVCAVSTLCAFNLILVSYFKRKAERNSLRLAGMTKGMLCKVLVGEAAILLLSTLILSALGGITMCAFLDIGMQSFGFRLF